MKFVHIVFDIFRIGSDNRAVVMVYGIRELVALIRNTGIKNKFYALFQKPAYMPVSHFCRITFGFTGNGFNSKLIDLSGGSR